MRTLFILISLLIARGIAFEDQSSKTFPEKNFTEKTVGFQIEYFRFINTTSFFFSSESARIQEMAEKYLIHVEFEEKGKDTQDTQFILLMLLGGIGIIIAPLLGYKYNPFQKPKY